MKLLNLLKKDKRSKKEILEKAMNSFSFNYHIIHQHEDNVKEVPFQKAAQCIPHINVEMHEVDYYA